MIELENVHVNIPVFLNEFARSVRTSVTERVFGGRLSSGRGGRVTVNALQGVSLKIGKGERVGFIGSNGAGKTTTLRVIAGIIPHSEGRVSIEGEVRSFFNIAAGLDPTRSGQANIEPMSLFYTRDLERIRDTIPSIIAFADVGEFIHLPVCTYSAGMKARLLIAIATAYGGDIIVFDEMLSAGDAAFIGRVEERLNDLVGAANCVVIASHSMDLVRQLCVRAIWLDQGKVRADGPVDEVDRQYREALP